MSSNKTRSHFGLGHLQQARRGRTYGVMTARSTGNWKDCPALHPVQASLGRAISTFSGPGPVEMRTKGVPSRVTRTVDWYTDCHSAGHSVLSTLNPVRPPAVIQYQAYEGKSSPYPRFVPQSDINQLQNSCSRSEVGIFSVKTFPRLGSVTTGEI